MSKKPINVLLIEDTTEYADLIQDWLCGEGSDGAFVLSWTNSLAAGLERLATVPVDVMLLDLSLPDSTGTNTFAKINEAAENVPVIVLSARKSESLALAMTGQGAAEYLVKSTCTAEGLIRAIRYAIIRGTPQVERLPRRGIHENRLIAVMGAKGGVGTTTITRNLAVDLARQTGERVLVCDLDSDAGLIAYLAGVEPDHTLPDAVDNINRLDHEFFEKLVTHSVDEMERNRQRLVVNDLNNSHRLSRDELGNMFGLGVAAVFPYESSLQNVAPNQRLPVDNSAFRKQMIRLARRLAGLQEAKPKRSMGSLFFRREEHEPA